VALSALVVDDERLARTELRRLLTAHPEVEVVAEAADAAQARARLDELEVDLLFLDVEMPGGTGFELLAQLDQVPQVIFTTAYDAHALQAFEVNALDYLLKPIEPRRLAEALSRVRRPDAAPRSPQRWLDRVFVRDGERCWFVRLTTVPLLESVGNYTLLHLPGRKPMLSRSLNYLEERLDPEVFFRASRKHLVNLSAIEALEPGPAGTLVARLATGHEVELSRRQARRFRERMSP
jgi:two-component system, LytTR family, response regulator